MSRKARFNLLVLEDSEYLLEEYTAVAFLWLASQDDPNKYELDSKQRGRVRICTRGIYFDPDDARVPISKYPLRSMPGKPQLLSGLSSVPAAASLPGSAAASPASPASPSPQDKPLSSAALAALSAAVTGDSLTVRDSFAFQVTQSVEMKANGVIGPYKPRAFPDAAAAAAAAAAGGGAGGKAGDGSSSAKKSKERSFFGGSGKGGGGGGKDSSSAGPAGGFSSGRATVVVALLHSPAPQAVALAQQLWDIQQACVDAHSGRERAKIEPLVNARREGPFDLSLLADYRERPLLPAAPAAITAERIFPLVTCPGRVMVTETAVYFQPVAVNNIAGSDPVQKWLLRDVRRIVRRPRLQREVGLELQLADGVGAGTAGGSDIAAAGLHAGHPAASCAFFAFSSPTIRDDVYRVILKALREKRGKPASSSSASASASGGSGSGSGKSKKSSKSAAAAAAAASGDSGASSSSADDYDDELGDYSPHRLKEATKQWQAGTLSNLQYLLLLNDAAGRTVADLTQYPVMPWVIADFTAEALDIDGAWDSATGQVNYAVIRDLSKPVGALNEARLKQFRDRYRDMPRGDDFDPPFLWGTHYSTPGYCLYYLVRSMPEHMLHLQAGRFDAPDRLFHGMESTWKGVTGTGSDLKELIPEFYTSDGSFLLSSDTLDLGVRQNGKRVADVALPPWAYDAGDLVSQCQAALECPAVSAQLHGWIDLIFGAKQRGEAAAEADNLFHHLTYSGAVDLEAITDADQRAAVQAQIAEFGQTPKQLFTSPHPPRSGPAPAATPLPTPLPTPLSPATPAATPSSAAAAVVAAAGPLSTTSSGGQAESFTLSAPPPEAPVPATTATATADAQQQSSSAAAASGDTSGAADGAAAAVEPVTPAVKSSKSKSKREDKDREKDRDKEKEKTASSPPAPASSPSTAAAAAGGADYLRADWRPLRVIRALASVDASGGAAASASASAESAEGDATPASAASSSSAGVLGGAITSLRAYNSPEDAASGGTGSSSLRLLMAAADGSLRIARVGSKKKDKEAGGDAYSTTVKDKLTLYPATADGCPASTQLALQTALLGRSTSLPLTTATTTADKRLLLTASLGGKVVAYDTAREKVCAELLLLSSGASVTALSLLHVRIGPRPDGKEGSAQEYIAVAGGSDGSIAVWPLSVTTRSSSKEKEEKEKEAEKARVKLPSEPAAMFKAADGAVTCIASPADTFSTASLTVAGAAAMDVAVGDASGKLQLLHLAVEQTSTSAASSSKKSKKKGAAPDGADTPATPAEDGSTPAAPAALRYTCRIRACCAEQLSVSVAARADVTAGSASGVTALAWLPPSSAGGAVTLVAATSDGRLAVFLPPPATEGAAATVTAAAVTIVPALQLYCGEVVRAVAIITAPAAAAASTTADGGAGSGSNSSGSSSGSAGGVLATAGVGGLIRLWSLTSLIDKAIVAQDIGIISQFCSTDIPHATLSATGPAVVTAGAGAASLATLTPAPAHEWLLSLLVTHTAGGGATLWAGTKGGALQAWSC